jgi:uncharacterized protein (TIGR00251 family)
LCKSGDGDLRRARKGLATQALSKRVSFSHSGERGDEESVVWRQAADFLVMNLMIPIHDSAGGASFAVKVHPRAKKNAVTGQLGDALKVSLTTPPVEGRANEACIEFFAKLLKVPRSSVTIASGHASRNKVLRIAGLTADELRKRLEQ